MAHAAVERAHYASLCAVVWPSGYDAGAAEHRGVRDVQLNRHVSARREASDSYLLVVK